jgi:hypothetical protein
LAEEQRRSAEDYLDSLEKEQDTGPDAEVYQAIEQIESALRMSNIEASLAKQQMQEAEMKEEIKFLDEVRANPEKYRELIKSLR